MLTAMVTPFTADGEVDYDGVRRLAAYLVDEQRNDGLVVSGTTGESPTTSDEEKDRILRAVIETVGDRATVVAGVGTNDTRHSVELARAAERAGADGLLVVTPYYNKPPQEGLYRHYAAIARETRLPIVLYNVPGRTGCDLLPETVERLAEIDNIVAIKEASDVRRCGELLARVGERIAVLAGDDVIALPVMALGGRGVISVASNVVPGHLARLCDAMAASDYAGARDIHFQLLPLFGLLFAEPNPIPAKTALELMGVMDAEVRLPLAPCSPALRARLGEYLRGRGLL